MKKTFKRAPKKLFDKFSLYFPYSTVDVAIRCDNSFILTRRTILPYKNKWNLPGGIVFKTEKLSDAAKRVAREELSLTVKIEGFLGVYENAISSRHDISHVFVASVLKGDIVLDFQSSKAKLFKTPPSDMVPYQKKILLDAMAFLKRKN